MKVIRNSVNDLEVDARHGLQLNFKITMAPKTGPWEDHASALSTTD